MTDSYIQMPAVELQRVIGDRFSELHKRREQAWERVITKWTSDWKWKVRGFIYRLMRCRLPQTFEECKQHYRDLAPYNGLGTPDNHGWQEQAVLDSLYLMACRGHDVYVSASDYRYLVKK